MFQTDIDVMDHAQHLSQIATCDEYHQANIAFTTNANVYLVQSLIFRNASEYFGHLLNLINQTSAAEIIYFTLT